MKRLLIITSISLFLIKCKKDTVETNFILKENFEIVFEDKTTSITDLIDSISYIKVNRGKVTYFLPYPQTNIEEDNGSYFSISNDRKQLFGFDNSGNIFLALDANNNEKSGPSEISYITLNKEKKLVYILDVNKNVIFTYGYAGQLISQNDISSASKWYYRMSHISDNKIFLQIKPSPAILSIKKEEFKNNIGDIYDLSTKTFKEIVIKEGSPIRSMTLFTGLFRNGNNSLFCYPGSEVVYQFDENGINEFFKFSSRNYVTKDQLNQLDNSDYPEGLSRVSTQMYENNKFFYLSNANSYNEIHTLNIGQTINENRASLFFYNPKSKKYVLTKYKYDITDYFNERPFKITNYVWHQDHMLSFMDGEDLVESNKSDQDFDPDATYLVKIYFKPFHKEFWK
jgi:hypothetical protein